MDHFLNPKLFVGEVQQVVAVRRKYSLLNLHWKLYHQPTSFLREPESPNEIFRVKWWPTASKCCWPKIEIRESFSRNCKRMAMISLIKSGVINWLSFNEKFLSIPLKNKMKIMFILLNRPPKWSSFWNRLSREIESRWSLGLEYGNEMINYK